MARLVSKTYGEALYDFAKESKMLEILCEEAFDVIDVFTLTDDMKKFMLNPKVGTEGKITFVRDVFAKLWVGDASNNFRLFSLNVKKGSTNKMLDFLSLVISKGRQADIVSILRYYIELTFKEKNIGEATIISASELSDEKKKILEKKLIDTSKYDKFMINYKVDKSLIAGIRIKVGDIVFDNTYKAKIFDISKSLRGLKL